MLAVPPVAPGFPVRLMPNGDENAVGIVGSCTSAMLSQTTLAQLTKVVQGTTEEEACTSKVML